MKIAIFQLKANTILSSILARDILDKSAIELQICPKYIIFAI
jgi:hypothetical protein